MFVTNITKTIKHIFIKSYDRSDMTQTTTWDIFQMFQKTFSIQDCFQFLSCGVGGFLFVRHYGANGSDERILMNFFRTGRTCHKRQLVAFGGGLCAWMASFTLLNLGAAGVCTLEMFPFTHFLALCCGITEDTVSLLRAVKNPEWCQCYWSLSNHNKYKIKRKP